MMEKEYLYIEATNELLEKRWLQLIQQHQDDVRWYHWKEEYSQGHLHGWLKTFLVIKNDQPIGEGTLIFDGRCSAVNDREFLVNQETCYVNALRIDKAYQGQGHMSKLMKVMEEYAYHQGYRYLTIGVEAKEVRNQEIYHHFGFHQFLFKELEEDEFIYYYRKKIVKDR